MRAGLMKMKIMTMRTILQKQVVPLKETVCRLPGPLSTDLLDASDQFMMKIIVGLANDLIGYNPSISSRIAIENSVQLFIGTHAFLYEGIKLAFALNFEPDAVLRFMVTRDSKEQEAFSIKRDGAGFVMELYTSDGSGRHVVTQRWSVIELMCIGMKHCIENRTAPYLVVTPEVQEYVDKAHGPQGGFLVPSPPSDSSVKKSELIARVAVNLNEAGTLLSGLLADVTIAKAAKKADDDKNE